jgi:pyruvate-formate lyase-activating enzyme
LSNYYCSQKFWFLSLDLERQKLQSCCAASPSKIDVTWLEKNKGQLFNTPELIKERNDLLNDIPVKSCEDTCWNPEGKGLPSRRTIMKSNVVTHTNVIAEPEVLHINVGSNCNLTCVYCGKQYSTAWQRDINNNGVYFNDNRFKILPIDSLVVKIGQKTIKASKSYNLILDEVKKYSNLKEVLITGGEPLLYNNLVDLLNSLAESTAIKVFTGLGVNSNRLQKLIQKIHNKNVEFIISAETTGPLYEFIRFGQKYKNFLRNLKIIENKFSIAFSSVLSNLTIHGFYEFEKEFADYKMHYISFCTSPEYLNINLMDNNSKSLLKTYNFVNLNHEIKTTLEADYTKDNKEKLKLFLLEYARRRNLSLNVLPESFVQWITE